MINQIDTKLDFAFDSVTNEIVLGEFDIEGFKPVIKETVCVGLGKTKDLEERVFKPSALACLHKLAYDEKLEYCTKPVSKVFPSVAYGELAVTVCLGLRKI